MVGEDTVRRCRKAAEEVGDGTRDLGAGKERKEKGEKEG